MRRRSLALLLVMAATPLLAEEASRNAKIERLLDITGVRQTMVAQMALQKEQSAKMSREILDNALEGAVLDDATKMAYGEAQQKLASKVRDVFASDKYIAAYGRMFGAHLSEAELEAMIAYFGSKTGNKQIVLSRELAGAYTAYVIAHAQTEIAAAASDYVEELKRNVRAKPQK